MFASVLSIDKDEPLITEVGRIELSPGSDPNAYGLHIKHRYGEDVVFSTLTTDGYASSKDGRFKLKGQFGAASWRNGHLDRLTLIGGTLFSADGENAMLDTAGIKATIRQVYDNKLVLDKPLPADTSGRVIFAERPPVMSSYLVEKIAGNTVYVSPGTWIGRGRVDTYDRDSHTVFDSRDIFPLGEKRNRLADITGMKYPEGNRNYYAGSWMVSEDGKSYYHLTSGGFPGFVLDPAQNLFGLENDFPRGKTFLLYDLGPGDTVRTMKFRQVVYKPQMDTEK